MFVCVNDYKERKKTRERQRKKKGVKVHERERGVKVHEQRREQVKGHGREREMYLF